VIGRTGAGDYGHQLDRAFTDDERARIVAVADPDDAGRELCRARVGAGTGYADYRAMLAAEHPDIVVVAPRQLDCHEEMVRTAVGAGAHVYCEKPIAQSLEQADRMVAAARERGVHFGIALPAVHESRFQLVRRQLADGLIGDLVQLRALCKWDHRGGGDDFLILGTHFADMMRRLAGDPGTCYARVSVDGRGIQPGDTRTGTERCGPVAGERIWASYTFPRHLVGTIESWRCDIADRGLQPYRLELQGTRGILLVRAPYADHSVWHCADPAFMPGRSSWRALDTEPVPTYGDYHRRAARDFLDAIEQGREPACSGEDGRRALEMIMAAYVSELQGSPVPLPLTVRTHPLARTA
jgi:predicted dehydrogenase